MVAPVLALPVDPAVEAPVQAPVEEPVEAPVDDEAVARQLQNELEGEAYDKETESHYMVMLRLMSAISADSTKHVVSRLDHRRANQVKDLVHVFKVLYKAISTDGLAASAQETNLLHRNLSDNLVRVARIMIRRTTRRIMRNGVRADEHEPIYSSLLEDAEYLRSHVLGEE